jgi:hypothetical protein
VAQQYATALPEDSCTKMPARMYSAASGLRTSLAIWYPGAAVINPERARTSNQPRPEVIPLVGIKSPSGQNTAVPEELEINVVQGRRISRDCAKFSSFCSGA